MSTKISPNIGCLYLQKFVKLDEPDVSISSDFSRLLKPFQIQGIRFLYSQYQKHSGAILNDESSLGKTVQTVLFLSALHTEPTKQSLVICDENKQHHWLYHFEKWSTIKATLLDKDKDISGSSVIIVPKTQIEIVNNYKKWTVVVVDNLEPITYVKHIQNINKCSFRVWLEDKSIKADIKKVFKILQWVSKNGIGNQKSFETTRKNNSNDLQDLWMKRQCLNKFCSRWLLRRTQDDVANQLPLINSEEYEVEYRKWFNDKYYKNQPKRPIENSSKTDDTFCEDLEDVCSMESSPSLLDISLKMDLNNSINKRKKDHSKIEEKNKKTKCDTSNSEDYEKNNKTINKTAEQNTPIKTKNEINISNSSNAERSPSLSCHQNEEQICPENISVKMEEESQRTQKFNLLESLFSQENKKTEKYVKISGKKIKEEKDEDLSSNSKPIDKSSSPKKTFQLLDRFLS